MYCILHPYSNTKIQKIKMNEQHVVNFGDHAESYEIDGSNSPSEEQSIVVATDETIDRNSIETVDSQNLDGVSVLADYDL